MEALPHNPAFGQQSSQQQASGVPPPQYPDPMQSAGHFAPQGPSGPEDAPPSYEDAIASDLPPLAGARPAYRPPTAPEGESTIDEKRR
jgi:hypothetical protein